MAHSEQRAQTIYMVGNAHIDPVWLWQWPEGYHEVLATFRSALDRIAEDPEFIFTAGSAAFYEWVEQCDPEMFEEIRRRVAEGRWQLAGGWWIEPDCNIPGGESFVRQGLYGQRYFHEKFGIIATVGYNPDSFGHSGMLPQILRKSGMQAYAFLRPSSHEKALPGDLFWWEAADGSRVLTFRIPYEYCSWPADIDHHVGRVASTLKPPFDRTLCFYGVGNHGGGPTRENLACIHRLAQDGDGPRVELAGLNRLLDLAGSRADADGDQPRPGGNGRVDRALRIPSYQGDLQHHAIGCYAAHSGIKLWNRQAENALLAAEKWAAIASWTTGVPYPAGELSRAWRDVLFNQFHDILAGSSVEPAYEDARQTYGEALAIAGRALNGGVQSLAWRIGIPEQEGVRPLVVFNPHAWPARIAVEVEFGKMAEGDVLVDDQNRVVPMQKVTSVASARGRNRLCFVAELPALGYRVYRVGAFGGEADPAPAEGVQAPPSAAVSEEPPVLENERFRLEIDRETGCIAKLYDKRHATQVFMAPAARPVVLDDPTDTWAHNIYRYDRVAGTFTPRRIAVVEDGPVKTVLRVESGYGSSTLVQDFALYRELDRIDVSVTVDWHEHARVLKLRFPCNLVFQRVTYEIPYGHIERFANGDEEPGQSWVDVSGESRDTFEAYGVSILNDGKYSLDVNFRDIGLTVVRSPIYAHHIPFAHAEGSRPSYMDQGTQHFTYTILPHAGSWEGAGTARRAAELNRGPAVLPATFHPHGGLPQSDSFLSVDRDNILVTVLKQAEDGTGDLVLRVYEAHNAATAARICLPHWGRSIDCHFGPCEIKTFRIPRDPELPVVETNLLEWTE